jgi:hypothetical protein
MKAFTSTWFWSAAKLSLILRDWCFSSQQSWPCLSEGHLSHSFLVLSHKFTSTNLFMQNCMYTEAPEDTVQSSMASNMVNNLFKIYGSFCYLFNKLISLIKESHLLFGVSKGLPQVYRRFCKAKVRPGQRTFVVFFTGVMVIL